MAPFLLNVYNVSGKTVHVDIDDLSFDIDNDQSSPINRPLPTEAYMKIYKIHEEGQGYLLKYVDTNIKINDPLGKKNGVADSAILTMYPDINIRITVFKDEIHISSDGKFLGIYQPSVLPKYYTSVVARHIIPQGGIKVSGGMNVEGDGDVKGEEVEVEDASPSTKGSDA